MARQELTPAELEIHKQAIASAIRKDFLKNDVSYQKASEMKYLVGYVRENENTKVAVRKELRDEFKASMAPVGNGEVAIVKRRDSVG